MTPRVLGPTVDDQTRCVHYATELDIIAIKFYCCGQYYPCHACHAETAGHAAAVWPTAEQDSLGILCGVCGTELRISSYLDVDGCPNCGSAFNPGCHLHKHLYFEA